MQIPVKEIWDLFLRLPINDEFNSPFAVIGRGRGDGKMGCRIRKKEEGKDQKVNSGTKKIHREVMKMKGSSSRNIKTAIKRNLIRSVCKRRY